MEKNHSLDTFDGENLVGVLTSVVETQSGQERFDMDTQNEEEDPAVVTEKNVTKDTTQITETVTFIAHDDDRTDEEVMFLTEVDCPIIDLT